MARRFKLPSVKERLLEEAKALREEAGQLPYGPAREAVLKKARQIEASAHLEDWINSPGLQPPKKDDTPGPQ